VENNGPVKGEIERQEKVKEAQRVENPSLDGGKEGYTTLYIWVPEGEMTLADSLHPDKTKWVKKCGKISFYQQEFAGENLVKVKQS
jgi:hypothetical protein